MDSDKIMVMAEGMVKVRSHEFLQGVSLTLIYPQEFDNPQRLLEDDGSLFSQLVHCAKEKGIH